MIRPPLDTPAVRGEVAAVSGADGKVLGRIELPEIQELYASPALLADESRSITIVVGSGGEVFPGSLWQIRLDAVLNSDRSGFHRLLPGDGASSFIAPVSVADLDRDGHDEVVAVRSDGRVSVIDATSGDERWSAQVDASTPERPELLTFTIAVPAIGELDGDPPLEIVVGGYAITEEDLTAGNVNGAPGSVTVLDGATGAVEHRLEMRAGFSVSSPLVVATANESAAVLCTCATGSVDGEQYSGESTGLGLWVPGRSDVAELGVVPKRNTTPAVVDIGGGLVVVSISEAPESKYQNTTVISAVPLQLNGVPVATAPWAGYMGTYGTGHYAKQ